VGRPNVGKSSLLNRLLNAERAVVSPIPGTTRDAVDSLLVRGDERYLFVDTAGIRKQRLLKEAVDHVSVVQARRSIERCDVAILVLDASEGPRDMDATIAGYAHEAGRGMVIARTAGSREGPVAQMRAFEQDVRGLGRSSFPTSRSSSSPRARGGASRTS
jgi:GTP-binding protein